MHRRDLIRYSPLALSAVAGHSLPALAQESAPSASYDVRAFGATGDGKTIDTPAINRAIEAVAAKGGGTLVFPAGRYLCFTIRLRSQVDLYLSRGCTIEAAASPRRGETTGYRGGVYDAAGPPTPWEPYQDYGHNHWANSLFYAEKQHGFGVFGPGIIVGSGLSNGSHSVRGGYQSYIAEQTGVGNKTFGLKECQNVRLQDFTVLKGGHFAVLATGVDNLILENLLIDTDRDGLDIDCCRNVRVSNCTINSPWDDAICPKSSYALGDARPTENVTIANNYVTGGYELGTVAAGTWKRLPDDTTVIREGRIKCGTESNGGFRNITITGNVIEGCKGIALESSDGALIEDVAITGNTMRDIVDAPLFLCLNRRNRNPKETVRPGALRRVLISNLVCHNSDAATASMFTGLPENRIEDVKLSNCFFGHKGLPTRIRKGFGDQFGTMPDWRTLHVPEREDGYPEPALYGPTPAHGFFIRHLRNLEMSHVEIAPTQPDPRPAFLLHDVHRADFFAVTAPAQPNFALHGVTDLRIAWSRAAKDATLASIEDQVL